MSRLNMHSTSRSIMTQWEDGIPAVYSAYTPSTRPSLRKEIRRLSRTITGSISSPSSSSGSSNDGSTMYSAVHMVATSGIATAAGSPTAVSSAGLSPTSNHQSTPTTWNNHESGYSLVAATVAAGSPSVVRSVGGSSSRRSISSTIRNFLLESTTSLASSRSRWSTSAVPEGRMSGLQEEDNEAPHENPTVQTEVVALMETTTSLGMDEEDHAEAAIESQCTNHLRVPRNYHQEKGLRVQTSFQSISTETSEVSWAGSWDMASEAYTPTTDVGFEDDRGSRAVPNKASVHNSRSPESEKYAIGIACKQTGNVKIRSSIQDSIICKAGFRATDPLYLLTKGGAEILEHVLGYLNGPSDITNLQLVCNPWDYLLRHSGVYHTLIRRRYPHIRPAPGEIQTTRTYEDLKRVTKQDKAIREGRLFPVTQMDIPAHEPRVRYHLGYACFNQASSGTQLWNKGKDSHEILVYSLRQGRKAPAMFSCSRGSKIMSVTMGGGVGNGVHLVYCEVDQNFQASISCYLLPGQQKKWQRKFPLDLVLSGADRAITQTNGFVTVAAVRDRILAWDENGRQIGENVLLPQQANFQAKKGGLLYLSSRNIYLITWGSGEPTSIAVYCNRTLQLVMENQLSITGTVGQVSGLVSDGKLYLAVSSHELFDLRGTWRLFCVNDKCPSTVLPVEGFPNLENFGNANLVYYPHHDRVYMISDSDLQCLRPTNNLSIVDISTGEEKRLQSKQGYLSDLMVDGDCSTWAPLQGDNEFLVWCTKGKMKVYRFDYDHYERD